MKTLNIDFTGKLIIEKDFHLTYKEPFFSAHRDYYEWFLSSEYNSPEYSFFSLGDYFHSSEPSPEEYSLAIDFFKKSKLKHIFILKGNHDYSKILDSLSISPLLKAEPRIQIIDESTYLNLGGINCLCLPYFYPSKEFTMEKEYTSIPEEFQNPNFIFHHVEDESISFGKHKQGIDLSYLKGKRIGGHIHTQSKGYELPMPIISRYDEKGQTPELGLIDLKTGKLSTFAIPKFLDYLEVTYPNDLPKTELKYPIWDVLDSPTKKEGIEYYSKRSEIPFHFRKIHKKETLVENSLEKTSGKSTLYDYFLTCVKEKGISFSETNFKRLVTIIKTKGGE